jgi:hypothetical protein
MFANTRPLARAVSIGVLGIALLDPGLVRAQSTSDGSGPASQSGVTAASDNDAALVLAEPDARVLNRPSPLRVAPAAYRTAADKTLPFYGKHDALRQATAQRRDALLNGAAIGAAVGAGIGVAVTHGVRDSDLEFRRYARGALAFAAIGAGVGLGIDALLSRVSPGPAVTPRRVLIAPDVWRDFAAVAVKWRW